MITVWTARQRKHRIQVVPTADRFKAVLNMNRTGIWDGYTLPLKDRGFFKIADRISMVKIADGISMVDVRAKFPLKFPALDCRKMEHYTWGDQGHRG